MHQPPVQAHQMTQARPTQAALVSLCLPQRHPRRRQQQEQVHCCSMKIGITCGGCCRASVYRGHIVACHSCKAELVKHTDSWCRFSASICEQCMVCLCRYGRSYWRSGRSRGSSRRSSCSCLAGCGS